MDAPADNTGQEVLGSIGLLVDRLNQQVLGTVWLADNSRAITCAHITVPYSNFPEALQVNFPATGITCGVKEIEFHPDFDRWMAKRFAGQTQLFPAFELISQAQNVAALRLVNSLKPLDRDLLPRITAALVLPPPQGETVVSGQAGRLELTSVLQTLVNARNFGTLVLLDDRNRIVARLFLEDGKMTHAQFRNSRNEEAIYRLITSCEFEKFPFYFTPQTQTEAQWCTFPPIEKNTTFLLMEAYRRMEELNQMVEQAGGLNMVAVRRAETINFDLLPEDWRPLSAYVWNCVNPEMSLGCLTRSLSIDAYSAIGALQVLCGSGQIALETRQPAAAGATLPLEMADDSHLSAGDDLYALGIDPRTNLPVIVRGFIVEEFWQGLDHHQVSSISLPLELAGAPVVKDGAVVGIHCGPLVQEIGHYGEGFEPQLMVTVQVAQTCLGLNTPQNIAHSGSYPPVKESAVSTANMVQNIAEQTIETDRYGTPSGNHSPVRARERLETREINAPMQAFSSLFGSIKGAVDNFKKAPPPPPGQFLQALLLRQAISSSKFSKVADNTEFQNGDMVRFEVKAFEDCFFYVLVKSASTTQAPRLVYPYSQEDDLLISKGTTLTLPERNVARGGHGKQSLAGIMIPGVQGQEEIYMLASRHSLFEVFNTANVEQIVTDNLSGVCADVNQGAAITRPAGAIFHGIASETQVFDPMEKINVLVLRLSHQRP
ncbi:MAG: DUF4388 domain-containing protein [Candidatus Obscuribacterales bacterium]|nr:DUF4388 domain-containing protein [Candidatus Obscuribacterales bacterium]